MADHNATAPVVPGRIALPDRHGNTKAYALVDADDFEAIGHLPWRLAATGYVIRFVTGVGRRGRGVIGPGHAVSLHRELLGLTKGDGKIVDHVNRDRLDNRRANLRVGTQGLNAQNRPGNRVATSEHRGVCWDTARRKWLAYGKAPGVPTKFLGRYDSEDEAARVAADFRREHMPWTVEGLDDLRL